MSPRGKPFVCWLSTEGHSHDVALHIGDEVEFNSESEGWVLAKIGTKRTNGLYVARWKNKEEAIWMMVALRPVSKLKKVGVEDES